MNDERGRMNDERATGTFIVHPSSFLVLQRCGCAFRVHPSSFLVPMPCVFCSDVSEAGELIFEDENAWVLLHPDWSPRGHAMVVAKRHAENASDLDEHEWLHVTRVFRKAEKALLEVTNTQRAFVMKLGIQTPHLHLHIYPMSNDATREDVFAAIDGKKSERRDDELVQRLTHALR
jgi:diadenosine tetraphosphate (Ap4A) HIT family hydrolase